MTYSEFCTMTKEARDLWLIVSVPHYVTTELFFANYEEAYKRSELVCSALAMLTELQKAYTKGNDIQKGLMMNVLRDYNLDVVITAVPWEPIYKATLSKMLQL